MALNTIDIPNQGLDASLSANQYLTFSLADEEYGVDILKVQEIKGYVPATRIPNCPPEITGVLNLRGTIVPIIDLRQKFGLAPAEYTPFTVIVVVVVRDRVMGMIVDSVSDVINISPSDIQPAPSVGETVPACLSGLGKVGDKLVILLDIEAVMLGETALDSAFLAAH